MTNPPLTVLYFVSPMNSEPGPITTSFQEAPVRPKLYVLFAVGMMSAPIWSPEGPNTTAEDPVKPPAPSEN